MDVGLVFDGGSNPIVVTEEYTKRRKLKKIVSGYPMNGSSSSAVEMRRMDELVLEELEELPRAAFRPKLPAGWQQALVAVLVVLNLLRPDQAVMSFVAMACPFPPTG